MQSSVLAASQAPPLRSRSSSHAVDVSSNASSTPVREISEAEFKGEHKDILHRDGQAAAGTVGLPNEASSSRTPSQSTYVEALPAVHRVPAFGQIPIVNGSNARSPNVIGTPIQGSLTRSREDLKGKGKEVVDLTAETTRPVTIDLDHYHRGPSLPAFGTEVRGMQQPVCFGELRTKALLLYSRESKMDEPLRADIPPKYRKRDAVAGRSIEFNDPKSIWEPVYIEARASSQRADHFDLRVLRRLDSDHGEYTQSEDLGALEESVAAVLGKPWAQGLVWGEARIERKRTSAYMANCYLTLYSGSFNAMTIPTTLWAHNIYLDQPAYFDHRAKYSNPHNPPPGGWAAAQARSKYTAMTSASYRGRYAWQGGGAGGTIENGRSADIASQIDTLLKSMGTAADTPEAAQPADLSTPLYKHQRQALWYIIDRESIHDFDEMDEKPPDALSLSATKREPSTRNKRRMISLYQKSLGPMGDIYVNVITKTERFEPPDQCRGCIIADDMGLGKTASTLSAVLASRTEAEAFAKGSPVQLVIKAPKSKKPATTTASDEFSILETGRSHTLTGKFITQDNIMHERARVAKNMQKRKLAEAQTSTENIQPIVRNKATLIVAPLSTVAGWEQQIQEHVKEGALSVYVYHGASRTSDPFALLEYDLVITTYNIIINEFSKVKKATLTKGKMEKDVMDTDSDSDEMKSKKRKRKQMTSTDALYSPLQVTEWFRIVLDEAHVIKEPSTVQSRAVCSLRAQRRLCLTGTPVQNHLNDLYALVKFLHLSPLDDRTIWNSFISSPVKFGDPEGISRLQLLMRSICLRRTKTQKDKEGKSILNLPARRDVIREVHLGVQEQALYDQNAARTRAQFNDLLRRGLVMKNIVSILQEIMRLRQICTHFGMVQDYEDKRDMDMHDGASAGDDLKSSIDEFGLTPKRARSLFHLLQESGSGICSICNTEFEETDSVYVTRCQHLFCLDCLRKEIWKPWPKHSATDMTNCTAMDMAQQKCRRELQVATDIYELKPLDPDCDAPEPVSVPNGNRRSAKASARTAKRRKKDYDVQHSSKVLLLTEELLKLREQIPQDGGRPIKTVVFSQWTSCLNRIEDSLNEVRISFRRLDGTMDRLSRAESLTAFAQDDTVLVLLISLRAGGVGLNLTAASRVYLMEPSWNPQAEAQAVDRIHRLGQTREVDIIRLIVPNSIESNMLKLQEKKLMLAQVTLSEKLSKEQMSQARLNELKALFK